MIALLFGTWDEYDASIANIASLVIALGTDNSVSTDPPIVNKPEEAE